MNEGNYSILYKAIIIDTEEKQNLYVQIQGKVHVLKIIKDINKLNNLHVQCHLK